MRRLTIVLVAVVLSGCAYNVGPYEGVRGSGNVKSESRDVQGFNRVEVIGVATVRITQGTTESLTVRAEDNLLSRFRSEVEGGTLRLGAPNDDSVRPTEPIEYDLTLKRLTSLRLLDVASAETASLDADRLTLRNSGDAYLHVDRITATVLTVDVDGRGKGRIDIDGGRVQRQTITIGWSGSYSAPNLASQQATVNMPGPGHCTVRVSDHLAVTISGAGEVRYAGSPQVEKRVSWSGQLTRIG